MADPVARLLDGLHAAKLLTPAQVEELALSPEMAARDHAGIKRFIVLKQWLTPWQLDEADAGRGDALGFGHFRLLHKLGDLPGREQFLAQHPALTSVVLLEKIDPAWLAPADTADGYLARLQAASLAQHPYLAGLFDAGQVDGVPFLVREFVEGATLVELVTQLGPLPVPLTCLYGKQLVLALQAAHHKGVCHELLTPHQVWLVPVSRRQDGEVSRVRPMPGASVKVQELGQSPLRPPLGDTSAEQIPTNLLPFLPPERMDRPAAGREGDCYAVGAFLYFLFTGRPPLEVRDSRLDQLLYLQQAAAVPLKETRSDLPPDLLALIARLLDRDPSRRPALVEVLSVLSPLAPATPVPSAPASGSPDDTLTLPGRGRPAAPSFGAFKATSESISGLSMKTGPLPAFAHPHGTPSPEVEPISSTSLARLAGIGHLAAPPGGAELGGWDETPSGRGGFDRLGGDSGSPPPPGPRKSRGWLVAMILVGVLLNCAALYLYFREPEPPEAPPETSQQSSPFKKLPPPKTKKKGTEVAAVVSDGGHA